MDHVPPQYQHDASLTFLQTARHYLAVTKPGIVFGNLITVMGGFFLASRGQVDVALFLATITGVSLIVAAGCVFNNCIDQDIDRRMVRTQYRALPQGWITARAALIYGSILGVSGALLLHLTVNRLALALALLGFVIYVGVYSLYMKRRSVYSTAIGSLSGAMPPVIGYCAVSGCFDATALILLVMFSLWQIPHFYAITLFRRADYRAAGIPLLPVATTKAHIVVTIPVFVVASLMPTLYGATGMAYLLVAVFAGVWWLALALLDYPAANEAAWARRLFFFSIVVVTALSFMMAVDF